MFDYFLEILVFRVCFIHKELNCFTFTYFVFISKGLFHIQFSQDFLAKQNKNKQPYVTQNSTNMNIKMQVFTNKK